MQRWAIMTSFTPYSILDSHNQPWELSWRMLLINPFQQVLWRPGSSVKEHNHRWSFDLNLFLQLCYFDVRGDCPCFFFRSVLINSAAVLTSFQPHHGSFWQCEDRVQQQLQSLWEVRSAEHLPEGKYSGREDCRLYPVSFSCLGVVFVYSIWLHK